MSDILLKQQIRGYTGRAMAGPKSVFERLQSTWPHRAAPTPESPPAPPLPDLLDILKPFLDHDLPLPDPFGPLSPYIPKRKK